MAEQHSAALIARRVSVLATDTLPNDTIKRLLAVLEASHIPLTEFPVGLPGFSTITPGAYPGSGRTVGVWISYQARTRYNDRADGTMGFAYGWGNPRRVRMNLGVSILDLSRRGQGSFGSRGSFNARVSRRFLRGYSVALGLENSVVWGFSDVPTSSYAVVSNSVRLREPDGRPLSQLMWSVGIGTGRYRTEAHLASGRGALNVFGSVATNLSRATNLSAEWTGQDASLGMSLAPFSTLPLTGTASVTDIMGMAGDGPRVTVGIGYSFNL